MSGREAKRSSCKQNYQQRQGSTAGAVAVPGKRSPEPVRGVGQPSAKLTALSKVLLLSDEDLACVGVVTCVSPCCGKLLVWLRPVSGGVEQTSAHLRNGFQHHPGHSTLLFHTAFHIILWTTLSLSASHHAR